LGYTKYPEGVLGAIIPRRIFALCGDFKGTFSGIEPNICTDVTAPLDARSRRSWLRRPLLMDALRESPDMMAMDVEDQHLPSYPTTRRSVMKPQQPLVLRGQQPKVKEMNKEKEEKASPPMKKEKKERTLPPPQKLATQTPRDGRLHIKVDSITQEELNEHIRLYGEELEGLSIHVTVRL
jgi:hypothetical protein